MTKPGNSDPADAAKAVPDETVSDNDTTSSLAPDPVEPADPAAAAPPEPEKAETKPEPEPAPKPKAKPKLEKAPPIPAEEPVMPTAREAAARAQAKRRFSEPAPRTLRISFYFFVASGLIWLASMVVSMIYKQDIIDAQIEASKGTDLTPDQIANGVTQILWIVTIAAVTFTVFLGLFGYKATEGTRRARTLVTIFGVVLVLFHLLLNGTPPGILSAMFCLVGLALLWSPSARRYFPPRELR
ncbi:hypothetical protein [Actinophytocola algeriensis]|uniref:Uncharacterized protein n=1 Tax=Actinophytocola algeriensis TaxID=1768010 RepID=A0A7W7VJ93_9PSEU|nr:hypothetical protein [Actinophytocola algeriensis]MBB4911835.1 hypothetical protein [Actinophytocola algeriensis]MBE1477673.1 hypothetical protein [Actinophytocola algeriensis]